MADQKITALTEDTSPTLDDLIVTVNSPSGSPSNKKVQISTLWSILNPPRGYLINGKIVPSVASNNLTVAIKGLDGNDPSATNPVYCRMGDTVRSITAALSVTCNAGTNWFNAGSSELATKEIDYFVYLGYNATDGVVIGFARLPSYGEYSDFSTTNTNEKYCAISNISHAAAGDDYELIGRFAATLSAGAGYTWTVPTFTNKNLIQRPIYTTRWLDWTPALSAKNSMTWASTSVALSKYKIDNQYCQIECNASGTTGGTPSTELIATLPFSSLNAVRTGCWVDSSETYAGSGCVRNSVGSMYVRTYNGGNYALGAGSGFYVNFSYDI